MKIRIAVPVLSVMALIAGFLTGGQAWADDDDYGDGIPATDPVILNFVVDPGGGFDVEIAPGQFIRLIFLTAPIDLIAGQTYEISVQFVPPDNLQVFPSEAPRGEEDVALAFFGGTDALPGGVTGTVDLIGVGLDFTGTLPLDLDAFFFPESNGFVLGQDSSLTDICSDNPQRCGFSFRGAHFSFTLPEDFASYTADVMTLNPMGGGFGGWQGVTIDVKHNVIDPNARGNIWVAVLSDTDCEIPFDPSVVDVPSIEFGPNGAVPMFHEVRDMNSDGLVDLLLQFRIPETGISCGDTYATLVAATYVGGGVGGTDSIRTTCSDDDNDDSDSDSD